MTVEQPEATPEPVEVNVEVTVPEPTPEPVAETHVVVVEATPEPEANSVDLDHESRITALEVRLDAIEQTANVAKMDAEAAINIAISEPPEPEIIVEPAPEPDTDPVIVEDEQPNNEHWFFKKGWF